ncbi:30S ribosomal protein S19 [Candidatus Woesearchaeota archaeon]|nr:30S ribosomal protein S19 [Candidatus Woesearchaeota archaeon]
MAKEFTYRGKGMAELSKLSLKEFAALLPSRGRRNLAKRGLTEAEQKFLARVQTGNSTIKTHCRDMIILPAMVGKVIGVHSGKEFVPVTITADLLGHRLGEFAMTRKKVAHSAPGIGATKSSASLSVR